MNILKSLLTLFAPFDPQTWQLNSFEKRWNQDGTVWLKARAHGALTALTPYGIIANEYGPVTAALPGAGKYIYVGVPPAAVDDATDAWLQIGGYVASMVTASLSVTVGHGLTVNTGAIADIGADYSGAAGEFCVNTLVSTTATTHNVVLIPERIITI